MVCIYVPRHCIKQSKRGGHGEGRLGTGLGGPTRDDTLGLASDRLAILHENIKLLEVASICIDFL